jgi:hypothetical protein
MPSSISCEYNVRAATRDARLIWLDLCNSTTRLNARRAPILTIHTVKPPTGASLQTSHTMHGSPGSLGTPPTRQQKSLLASQRHQERQAIMGTSTSPRPKQDSSSQTLSASTQRTSAVSCSGRRRTRRTIRSMAAATRRTSNRC